MRSFITYSSPSTIRMMKSRRMRWAGRVAYRILVGKAEGKRPLGRPRRRWEDCIKMALREMGGSRDSSVGIATGYGLDDQEGREFESR
jgi:hypothetical protein